MDKPTFTVVMCTYHGEPFLTEQLDSIAAQRRLPDRLLVVDDASRDGTVSLARAFAARAPFPVEVVVNARNLGFARNFEQAIRLADADLIALADQDDVWHPEKLAKLEAAFAAHPECWAVFTDAEVVDARLRPLGFRLWASLGFDAAERARFAAGKALQVLVKHYVVTGATMALRGECVERVLPIPEGCFHDGWIALAAAAEGRIGFIDEPLIQYRQHARNAIGAKKQSVADRVATARDTGGAFYERQWQQFRAMHAELQARFAVAPELLALLEEKVAHLATRVEIYRRSRQRRIGPILRELRDGRYHRFSNGYLSAVRDWLA